MATRTVEDALPLNRGLRLATPENVNGEDDLQHSIQQYNDIL